MEIALNERAQLKVFPEAAYVTFPGWNVPGNVRYGYSTRLLGVSEGIFASMNLGQNRGDEPARVRENYRRMCDAIGLPTERLVLSKQVHLCHVQKVTEADVGNGFFSENRFEDADALMTNERNVPLVIFTSDCVPVFLYDSENKAIALVHAGWRGTVGGICRITVESMKREYGTDPGKVVAAIGPSICRKCFEIGPEVAEQFDVAFAGKTDEILSKGEGDRFYADLWRANEEMLLSAGVRRENITVSGLCTMCRPDLFFSHRATNGQRGSNAGFLMLG